MYHKTQASTPLSLNIPDEVLPVKCSDFIQIME